MTAKAEKLLERLRCSTANCTRQDLDALYTGYGFNIRRGGKHDIATHPRFPKLRATLPNHAQFATGYVTHAIKLIDELLAIEKPTRRSK